MACWNSVPTAVTNSVRRCFSAFSSGSMVELVSMSMRNDLRRSLRRSCTAASVSCKLRRVLGQQVGGLNQAHRLEALGHDLGCHAHEVAGEAGHLLLAVADAQRAELALQLLGGRRLGRVGGAALDVGEPGDLVNVLDQLVPERHALLEHHGDVLDRQPGEPSARALLGEHRP